MLERKTVKLAHKEWVKHHVGEENSKMAHKEWVKHHVGEENSKIDTQRMG